MKTKLFLLTCLLGSAVMATEYTLDFGGATLQEAEAPVLRRAEMAADVGTVPAVAVGDTLNLRLFGDVDYAFNIVSAPPAGIAGQSFIAKDANGSASAIVKVNEKTARISIDDFMNRRQYIVRCKDGKALIIENDNSQVDDGECGTCGGEIEMPQPVEEETTTTSIKKSRKLLGASGDGFPLAEQKSVVDILVAFDQGAKAWVKNVWVNEAWKDQGTIEEFADYAVDKMNLVLTTSQLDDLFAYRLAGVTTIDATYSAIDNSLLGSLRYAEGPFAKIPALREKYGADTVTLLINKTAGNTSGIGYPLQGTNESYYASFNASWKNCNVCDIYNVDYRHTMSHETGHNMGCGHSNQQGPKNSGPEDGPFPYSCGYHFTAPKDGKRYHTVMAYYKTENTTGTNYSDYQHIPYFSSPDMGEDEFGCPVGTAELNDNRRVLTYTYKGVSDWQEHIKPYEYDVRFLDDNGNDIPDGTYFPSYYYVTLTNSIPNATIYYTYDDSTPTSSSAFCQPGTRLTLSGSRTITACAVVGGVAQSVRTIHFKAGMNWTGASNGSGLWLNGDSSVRPWDGEYFYNGDVVKFPDVADGMSPTVTVKGTVSPGSVAFTACETSYTFEKGDEDAKITIPDANFAPVGDVTFNVPVQLGATTFTNMVGRALTFNAPFGQTVDNDGGTFTGMVNIGPSGTLTVAPGSGKTQTIGKLNNVGWYANTSTFRVGEGKVIFNGALNKDNKGAGVIGRTRLEVVNGGELVFNMGGGTGFEMNNTSLTIEKGGVVRFNDMEHLRRTLYLSGGTIYAKRLDLMSNPGIYVTDDSSIENNNGGYIIIRGSDSEINVSDGKTLTVNVGTQTDNMSDASSRGIVKRGGGTLVANGELKHSGVTDIEAGTLEVGYSSGSTIYGQGWIVASNAMLKVKSGCALNVPSLTLDPTATISVSATNTAPLIVNGNLDLTEVGIAIRDVEDLSLGASYPLVSATGEISGVKSLVRASWPKPATGLGWKLVVADGTLTASIVNAVDADPVLDFITNIPELRLSLPDDATMTDEGGLELTSPIGIDILATNAVSVTLDVTLDESTAEERTLCSWKIGSAIVRCVVTNGVIDCFYASNSHVSNSAQFVKLSAGRHVVNVAYKSLSDDTYGGTFVYVDGQLAYRGAGLRWSNDSVSRVTIGASADDTPAYKYEGLVVNSLALLTPSANEALPNMTSSGGAIEYNYFAGKPPCVFALTPDGGFETYSAILSGAFPGSYDALSVSVVASFPEDATGTIVSSAVLDGYYAYSTQVEYSGNGVLAFRDNGSGSLIASVQVSADMSTRHLYTLTYTNGTGYKLYLDGAEVLSNTSYYNGKNMPIINRVVFGCGYWTNWMTSFNDYPNPMPNLKVYASHIALGTDDRTVSETPVKEATGYDSEEPEDPEDPEEPDPEPPATPAVVDVLVAYDNGAYNYVTSRSRTLEEFAQTQIDKMNDVLATNRLDRYYGYRLAGVCKVDGTYTNIDTAPGLIAAGEGPAVSLRAAREIYGADTVTLLVDTTSNTIGNSSPLNSTNNVASQHECAFSVCSIRAVDTGKQHTMIHENAHNMGCGHARAQNIINSPFEYGRGYYFKDGDVTRHTIMAYGGDNDASWYFSTASREFGYNLGNTTNNNARVLKETCSEVAKWREGAAIPLAGIEITGVELETSSRFPWYVDDEGLVRSYNRTEYDGNQCTTPLRAAIEGPRRLSFSHKSYFGGESVAGNNYSHFDVLLDDSPVFTQTECTNEWTEAYVDVPEGTHEVTFVFSQRFAMNNPSDYKEGEPDADDAVWLKDLALNVIPHSSTRDDVSWTFPADAVATSDYLDGIILEKNGIKETLNFGSTNAVVLSVLAELPQGVKGEIAGCHVCRASSSENENFYAFAYSNGDGTFSLGHGTTTNQVTSSAGADWTALHVWTFAFVAQEGAYLYCDGKEIVKSTTIKWDQSSITNIVAFCDDPRSGWTISDAKIYAVHSDFGMEGFSNVTNTPASNASAILSQFACLADYADESIDNKLALLSLYKEKGSIPDQSVKADSCVLRISEIMPKPTDDQDPGLREGMDVNGLESGWVEVENTSSDKWADLADYRFIRVNRGKKTDPAGFGNFPSRLVPPHGRAIFYTSERYANSKDITVSAWATPDPDGNVPKIYADFNNVLVWPDKVNPKKSPYVRLYYAPVSNASNIVSVVDTVVIPSDLPEGWSIIVGKAADDEGTRRWMCPTPTRGKMNTKTDGLTRIGPNVGPLYEKKGQKKTDLANEFATNTVIRIVAPPAVPGEDYAVTLPINPVMNPAGILTTKETPKPRDADKIQYIKFVYRKDLDNSTLITNAIDMTVKTVDENWGDLYTATIPAVYFPERGHLIQWKVLITDGEGVEWTSPSFNNKDDGYEWYGTIVEAPGLESATLPTWHMFAAEPHLTQMDKDKDDQDLKSVPNYARIAIYDSSTSNYYDYVRIDLRGHTSAGFTKKGHGLRFAKAHPLTMTDVVTGEQIKEIRKTSLISEFADPSYMRQMIAFWLWRKMGNLVPFDFPVRCNLNGEFYQLAFNSERFTDELIEDVYGLDKFGYGYKNVGTLKSGTGTTAGKIEKKTPDDEDESNIKVLQNELRAKIIAAQNVSSSPDGGDTGLDNADLTKFVVEKFNLPAWLNYLASARITQEMDDVWANVCAYYDNAEMKEGVRGTDTWMPLGYDFNLSFGQWHYNDLGGTRFGLMSNQDWFKSHPFYGGNRVWCYSNSSMTSKLNNGNDGFEAVWQSAKFRRLYLRRLRTLMDQELKEPGTDEEDTPFMVKMREMANLMRADAERDQTRWPNDDSDNVIQVWSDANRPANIDAGIQDIWDNYVVPRREHLYVTHSVTNITKTIGYGSNLNAGIPEAQSPIADLKDQISVTNLSTEDGYFHDTEVVVIYNGNDEVVDMSGWKLAFSADFTFPAGTVCDARDYIYIVADRRQYIEDHKDTLTDEVIVGNATITGTGPIVLYDADGVEVFRMVPETNELNFLRLHSFCGNTNDGESGDTGEWFALTNISDSVTLDLADVTVCFLKQGDDHDTTTHCHVTLTNKKGKGDVKPLKSWTANQADWSDKGWTKIQNNKQQITIYDKYGSVCQSLKVTQKSFDLAYGKGGYLVCDSTASEVKKDSDWHQELAGLPNNGEESVPFKADDIAAASNILANASVTLTQEDIDAGLEAQYLTVVPKPVEGEAGKYKAVVDVNPETVAKPEVDTSVEEPMAIEDDTEDTDKKQISVSISNAVIGLWYGYEVANTLGPGENFQNDVDSFKRATGATHTVTGSPRDKSETSAFFRVKVLPAKPPQP